MPSLWAMSAQTMGNECPNYGHWLPRHRVDDCLKLKTVNGILLLTFDDIFEAEDMATLKRSASLMPSTFAVIEGADGTSAHVLVRYTDIDGEIPQNEEDAEELHRMAAKQIVPLYQTLIKEDLQPLPIA